MGNFNFVIPLTKSSDTELVGVASATSVDRDEERMSSRAVTQMVKDIKEKGVNLFGNHEHSWENTLGFIHDAEELPGEQVGVKIGLDDPTTNPKIPMLLNKLARGIKLGLSVGGNVQSYKWDYDRKLGKKIKVLDDVRIYEVSVVGIPSNPDAFVALGSAISKCAKEIHDCPCCYSPMTKHCGVCFYG